MLDVILDGGLILDGTGGEPFVTDLAVARDRIVRVGDCSELEAVERLDVSGLAVSPGFIDMHSHSDEVLLALPTADGKIRQGITLEVGGNCGFSPAPLRGATLEDKRREMRERYGIEMDWSDFEGFFSALERSPAALNFCCLVGLGTVRGAIDALGPAPLDREQTERAATLVREACEQGAIGVSSGLIYPPGRSADTTELVALSAAAADGGAPLYASHIRSEGGALVEAVDEALDVGRRSGCAVQLSHHKAAGRRNWGKVHDTLARVDRARGRGLDVVLDQYPYKASSTGLDVILPDDVNVGPRAQVVARLADPQYAALVAARVELEYGNRWHEVLLASVSSNANRRFEGQTMSEIGAAMGCSPVAAALRLLVDEKLEAAAIYFTMCEDDVKTVLSYRNTCIGTDASARALSGPTARGKPHPRTFGTFPRIFKRYVRDTGVLSLAEAVRRATSLPATRLGLRDRGALAAGAFADIVVFDDARIADTATYAQPYSFPRGIEHVFVNGAAAVRDAALTAARSGRVLRRGRDL